MELLGTYLAPAMVAAGALVAIVGVLIVFRR